MLHLGFNFEADTVFTCQGLWHHSDCEVSMVFHVPIKGIILWGVCACCSLVSFTHLFSQQVDEPAAIATPVRLAQELEGTVVADKKVVFRNRTNQELAIVWLVAEGTRVQEGDLLVRLDSSLIQDRIEESKIEVISGEAQLAKSEAELEVAMVSRESLKQQLRARLALIESREEMMFSEDGELALTRKVLESTIVIEEERGKLLKAKVNGLGDEVQADPAFLELKFQIVQSENELKIATAKLSHLNGARDEYERRKLKMERELCAAEGERDLAEAELRISEAQAKLVAHREELRFRRQNFEQLVDEVKQCEIRATEGGVVFYCEQNSNLMEPIIEEGEIVRSQQSILYLPDLNSLHVEFELPEAWVNQVERGQEVIVLTDDGGEMTGQVQTVANWSSAWGDEGKKTYRVVVRLTNPQQTKIGQHVKVRLRTD